MSSMFFYNDVAYQFQVCLKCMMSLTGQNAVSSKMRLFSVNIIFFECSWKFLQNIYKNLKKRISFSAFGMHATHIQMWGVAGLLIPPQLWYLVCCWLKSAYICMIILVETLTSTNFTLKCS